MLKSVVPASIAVGGVSLAVTAAESLSAAVFLPRYYIASYLWDQYVNPLTTSDTFNRDWMSFLMIIKLFIYKINS